MTAHTRGIAAAVLAGAWLTGVVLAQGAGTPAPQGPPPAGQTPPPPAGRGADPADCKISDHKVDGNKVTWSMTCPKDQMTGAGEFLYSGDTYTGTMKMNARGQDMTMKYNGKRLGDCTK